MKAKPLLLAPLMAIFLAGLSLGLFYVESARAAVANDLQKLTEAAKSEGKLVISIPPSAELRKALEDNFGKRFGIELELIPARGATLITRMVDEAKAGVAYFDLHIGGTESAVRGLLSEGILDPVEPWIVMSEVKDAKNWWGGHIWMDNAKRFIYSFAAYQTEGLWHNTNLAKAEEISSFDDLLSPKWQGKIGFSDPRAPGSGASMWSYMRSIKGEAFVKNLVGQKMFISRDLRVLAESTARDKLAIAVGLSYADFAPFLKAGMPIQPLPRPKEGMYVTTGYGNLMVLKNAPHPHASRLFINWLLGKQGQEVYSQGMAEPSRRLDVEASALKKIGITAAKDSMSIGDFYKRENQSEEQIYKVRVPGAELARRLLD